MALSVHEPIIKGAPDFRRNPWVFHRGNPSTPAVGKADDDGDSEDLPLSKFLCLTEANPSSRVGFCASTDRSLTGIKRPMSSSPRVPESFLRDNLPDLIRDGAASVWATEYIGQQVESYTLESVIGSGTHGVVFGARRTTPYEQTVAIKLLPALRAAGTPASPSSGINPKRSNASGARFREECQALADLDHPGIAGILTAGVMQDGTPYLVMPLLDGVPIDDYVRQTHADWTTIADLVRQLSSAVAFAHCESVVHCDLKPDNILVDRNGKVTVTDFGLAVRLDRLEELADRPSWSPGTIGYCAPEIIVSRDSASPAVDIYSMGAVLHKLMTGEPPHHDGGWLESLIATIQQSAAPVQTGSPNGPNELAEICNQCLAVEPQARPSAEEVESQLSAFRRGKSLQKVQVRRSRTPVAIVGALTIATGVVLAISVMSGTDRAENSGVDSSSTDDSPPTRIVASKERDDSFGPASLTTFQEYGHVANDVATADDDQFFTCDRGFVRRWTHSGMGTPDASGRSVEGERCRLAISGGRDRIAVVGGYEFAEFDRASLRDLKRIRFPNRAKQVAFSPNETELAVAGEKFLSLLTLDEDGEWKNSSAAFRAGDVVAYDDLGRLYSTQSYRRLPEGMRSWDERADRQPRHWRVVVMDRSRWRLQTLFEAGASQIYDLDATNDGIVAASHRDGSVSVYTQTENVVRHQVTDAFLWCVAFDPTGEYVAVGDDHGVIHVLRPDDTGLHLVCSHKTHRHAVTSLQFISHLQDQTIVSSGLDHRIVFSKFALRKRSGGA